MGSSRVRLFEKQVIALLGGCEEFAGQGGHGTVLGADVGADLDG